MARIEEQVVVNKPHGLHARPATIFVQLANKFNASVMVEKDGEIVFQNKTTDLPKIRYRISSPGKMVSAQWKDLKIGDKVVLTISYDSAGQIESRILRVFRE